MTALSLTTDVKAPIGDSLRVPVLWCDMYPCVEWFSAAGVAGFLANRILAMKAGWKKACPCGCTWACPRCQQTSPAFRGNSRLHPVPYDEYGIRGAAPGSAPAEALAVVESPFFDPEVTEEFAEPRRRRLWRGGKGAAA